MAIYIKVTATARIKIQDPYDKETIEQAKEETILSCSHELLDEDYQFEVEDAD